MLCMLGSLHVNRDKIIKHIKRLCWSNTVETGNGVFKTMRSVIDEYQHCSQCHQIPYKSRNQVPLQEEATLQPRTIPGPPQMRTSLLRHVAAYTNNNRSAVKTNQMHGETLKFYVYVVYIVRQT